MPLALIDLNCVKWGLIGNNQTSSTRLGQKLQCLLSGGV
jgi:hypothetical protein